MEFDVIIYMEEERFSLDIVVPEQYVGDFVIKFGVEFAVNTVEEETVAKEVDYYYSHPAGWHVGVSITSSKKDQLYQFIRNFCRDKGLSFRDPDKPQN